MSPVSTNPFVKDGILPTPPIPEDVSPLPVRSLPMPGTLTLGTLG